MNSQKTLFYFRQDFCFQTYKHLRTGHTLQFGFAGLQISLPNLIRFV